jgi:heterodisulfide reductase subunit C
MEALNLSTQYDRDFVRMVEEQAEQKITHCYQCGNCTAGCPFSFAYDVPANLIMRLVQAGQKDAVLGCKSIWLCATCETCTTRCPNNIDVARVIEVLRQIARREGRVAVSEIAQFRDAFLQSIQAHGRLFETGVLAKFVVKTGRGLGDFSLGPRILSKGKLSFLPPRIQGKAEIAQIFERFKKGAAL